MPFLAVLYGGIVGRLKVLNLPKVAEWSAHVCICITSATVNLAEIDVGRILSKSRLR